MILLEIDLGYSPIPDGCMRRLDEVSVKRDGHVWRIHRNDADPFPSHLHAHNVESGLKLDLTTGNLYLGTQFTKRRSTEKTCWQFGSKRLRGALICPRLRSDHPIGGEVPSLRGAVRADEQTTLSLR
jgi:hypothetical protein